MHHFCRIVLPFLLLVLLPVASTHETLHASSFDAETFRIIVRPLERDHWVLWQQQSTARTVQVFDQDGQLIYEDRYSQAGVVHTFPVPPGWKPFATFRLETLFYDRLGALAAHRSSVHRPGALYLPALATPE